jgi:hypothetical protein
MSRARWAEKLKTQRSTFSAQMLQNPLAERWESKEKEIEFTEVLKAFALLGPALEYLAAMRAMIIEQRGNEAVDVTPGAPDAAPLQEKTLELLRDRFMGIMANAQH